VTRTRVRAFELVGVLQRKEELSVAQPSLNSTKLSDDVGNYCTVLDFARNNLGKKRANKQNARVGIASMQYGSIAGKIVSLKG